MHLRPVSYTHLDVYKRQECAPYMAMNASGGNFESGTNIQIYPIDLTSAHKLYLKKGEIKIPAVVKDYNGRYDGCLLYTSCVI